MFFSGSYMCLTLRKESRIDLELDATHYLYTPAYTWDAMKRFTCVRLNLISDIEEYLSIESMIKRGSSMISMGYAKANNKF